MAVLRLKAHTAAAPLSTVEHIHFTLTKWHWQCTNVL